jgi:hypothetical protein
MAIRDPQLEHQRGNHGVVILGVIAICVVPIFLALAGATRALGPASIPIWFAAMGAGAYALRGPVGQAIARALEGRTPEPPLEVPPELYAELDELRARVGELEERVDFSERLLTKAKDEERNG